MAHLALQVEGFLVLIIVADRSMPFQGTYREEFLMDVGRLTSSIAVVVETALLSLSDLEALEEELGYVIIIDSNSLRNALYVSVCRLVIFKLQGCVCVCVCLSCSVFAQGGCLND